MSVTAREKAKRKKRDKRKKTGRAHDASSGKYVSQEFAAAHPEQVVEETEKVESPGEVQPDEGMKS